MKILFNQKQEVNIGDLVPINGIEVEVTQQVIDNNPDYFEVKEKEWAKRYLFTTEDGVDIFENGEYWIISEPSNIIIKGVVDNVDQTLSNAIKRFSTKKAAQSYLNSIKKKSLKYYEDILLDNKGTVKAWYPNNNEHFVLAQLSVSDFYKILKGYEPKLYWSKILQLIADDLNGDWKPDWNNYGDKWFIKKEENNIRTGYRYSFNYGTTIFKSKDLVEKAIKIMGDKLKNIFDV